MNALVHAYTPRVPEEAWAEIEPLVRLGMLAVKPASRTAVKRTGLACTRHVLACRDAGISMTVTGV